MPPREEDDKSWEQSLGERRKQLLESSLYEQDTGDVDKERRTSHIQGTGLPPPLLKPLIDNVTNSWRDIKQASDIEPQDDDERELRFCDWEDKTSCPHVTLAVVRSRRFRRMLAVLLICLLLACYVGNWVLRPQLEEDWEMQSGFMPGRLDGTYGIARGGHFEGTRIKDLDPSLVPGGTQDTAGDRRLVFVGDIHGCKHELLKLLEKVGFNEKLDHLVAVGDVVTKGPENVAVLDELIRLKADTVRGNHEDRLLVAAAKSVLYTPLTSGLNSFSSKGAAKDTALLRQLKPHHLDYMRRMPLMLRIPALPRTSSSRGSTKHITHEIIVVHAGLVPRVPLAKQDPFFVMNMRSIDHRTHIPSAARADKSGPSKPWFEVWNWYNNHVSRGKSIAMFTQLDDDVPAARESWLESIWRATFGDWRSKHPEPQVVIYGHDSKEGLHIKPWSKGLDTACVRGGKLTALVLNAKGKQEIVSVGCKDYKD